MMPEQAQQTDKTAEANALQTRAKDMEDNNEIEKNILKNDVYKFYYVMRQLASKQQIFATKKLEEEINKQPQVRASIERFSDHGKGALKLFGTSRVAALVIGFDMESDGISSALLRVFQRVRKSL